MPSIQEDVAAAFDETEGAADETVEAEPVEAEPIEAAEAEPAEEPQSSGDSRVRDDSGRFARGTKKPATRAVGAEVKGQGKADGAASPAVPSATPVPGPALPTQTPPPQQGETTSTRPPSSLTLGEREAWDRGDVAGIKNAFARIDKDVRGVMQESAELRKAHGRLQETFGQHADFFRNNGLDPMQTVGSLLADARVLWSGNPNAAASKIAQIMNATGVSEAQLAAVLDGGGHPQGEPQQQQQSADPRAIFREEMQRMLADASTKQQQQRFAEFANSHGYLKDERLGPQVKSLMETAKAQGIAKDDESAYAWAINSHPEIAPWEQQKKAAANAQKVTASTQLAKAAASSVKGKPGLQNTATPKGIRATVEAAFDAHER